MSWPSIAGNLPSQGDCVAGMNWKNSDDVFDEFWGGCSTEVEGAATEDFERTGGPEEMKSMIRARGCSEADPFPLFVAGS